ncbi:MAG: TonB-dependent receptor [Bacteroidetes bacterium]|nr:TonB-dependent receptor [Bacteroidota bacterium]
MMKRILLAIPELLITLYQPTFAQTTTPDTTKNINLNEVTISANKTEDSKRNVAQQVQSLNAKQIADLQCQSTADVIANTGSVFVQKSQLGGGSPVIRGFEANRILLVIDGVRMNNIIYRAGHLQNIVTTDNSSLERIEVLFGPSSTMYGSDALGGVIALYTKRPGFASGDEKRNLKVNAFTRYGMINDDFTAHFDFNIGGKKLASLTSFTYNVYGDLKGGENQNPFYTGSYGERPYYVERINGVDSLVKNSDRYLQVQSGFSQYDFSQRFALKQGDHIVHGLNIQYSNSTDVPRYDRLTDPGGSGLRYAEWYYGPQMRLLGAYDFQFNNGSAMFQDVHAGINFQNIEESRHTRRFNNVHIQHRVERVNVIGFNADFKRTTNKHTLRFGLDAQYNTLESTAKEEDISNGSEEPVDTRYPDGDNTMSNAAVYFSHTWRINNNLTLTDGLRVGFISLNSTFKDTSFFHLPFTEAKQSNPVYSGSIGLIQSPSDDLKLSLLLSTGFRAPNVDDLAKVFESAPGAVIVPNSDLKPEKTITTEIGIMKIYNEKTSWENTVYYTSFIDAIVTDEFKFNGQDSIQYDGSMSKVYANQNKGEAFIYGFSSNLTSQCTDHLRMTVGINYTYGRVKTDTSNYPLDHIPPFLARMGLKYTYDKFGADFFVNYNGWKKLKDYYLSGEDNEQYATPEGMPAWFTVNLHASYKAWRLLTVQAGVDNIFDTQYRMFASGINGAGRNVFLALRFHY